MLNKSEVMKKAWAIYNEIHATYADWQFERGIHDGSFSHALKCAWRVLKALAAEAAKKAKEAGSRFSEKFAALRSEMDMLPFRSFRYDIRAERSRIQGEINALVEGSL